MDGRGPGVARRRRRRARLSLRRERGLQRGERHDARGFNGRGVGVGVEETRRRGDVHGGVEAFAKVSMHSRRGGFRGGLRVIGHVSGHVIGHVGGDGVRRVREGRGKGRQVVRALVRPRVRYNLLRDNLAVVDVVVAAGVLGEVREERPQQASLPLEGGRRRRREGRVLVAALHRATDDGEWRGRSGRGRRRGHGPPRRRRKGRMGRMGHPRDSASAAVGARRAVALVALVAPPRLGVILILGGVVVVDGGRGGDRFARGPTRGCLTQARPLGLVNRACVISPAPAVVHPVVASPSSLVSEESALDSGPLGVSPRATNSAADGAAASR